MKIVVVSCSHVARVNAALSRLFVVQASSLRHVEELARELDAVKSQSLL